MNDRQNAKLSMYNVVITVLDNNPGKVATVPALVTTLAGFNTVVTAISNTAELQATITTGVTPDKNATRETLRTTTVANAGILHAFSVSVSDIVLQELSKITYTSLRKLKDDELAERAQTIHDAANTHIAALPPFGITVAVLASFQSLIDTYQVKSPAPRAAQSQQVALTTQLKELFKQADNILKNSLDKLMLNFKAPDPEFSNTYIAAREIMDAATSNTQVSGIITNLADNTGIGGVSVTVQGGGYNTISLNDGSYTLKIPVPGDYKIVFNKPGFAENSENVTIALGQTATLDIQLAGS